MLTAPTKTDRAIVLGIAALSFFMVFLCIYGIVAFTLIRPERNAEIQSLQSQVEVLTDRKIELEEANEIYSVALKFQELFLMVADAGEIMELDKYLKEQNKNKAEFCLGDCREVGKCEK